MKYLYQLNKCEVVVKIKANVIEVQLGSERFFAKYPMNMEDVAKDLIDAMIWILFYDYGEFDMIYHKGCKIERQPFYPKERKNTNTVISFSGGIDSTAILNTFPEAQPIHLLRSYDATYSQKQMKIVDTLPTAVIIPNDMERIRKLYGKGQGFNVGFGYTCLLMPLIDKLKIKRILFGVVFDDLGFYYGDPFLYNGGLKRTNSTLMFEALKTIGVEVCYPFAGLSEVWTTRIVNDSKYNALATSCHDKSINTACRACFKCFRKQGILGKQIPLNNTVVRNNIEKNLEKPVKMAASTVYGIQKAGYQGRQFDRFKDIDVSFLDRWNPEITAIYNPSDLCEVISEKMKEYGIKETEPEDAKRIKHFVEAINSEELYAI